MLGESYIGQECHLTRGAGITAAARSEWFCLVVCRGELARVAVQQRNMMFEGNEGARADRGLNSRMPSLALTIASGGLLQQAEAIRLFPCGIRSAGVRRVGSTPGVPLIGCQFLTDHLNCVTEPQQKGIQPADSLASPSDTGPFRGPQRVF